MNFRLLFSLFITARMNVDCNDWSSLIDHNIPATAENKQVA